MSNTSSTTAQRPAPADGAGDADLAALADEVARAERHMAAAVTLAGRLAGSGVSERVEGLPLEHFLGLAARLTGADRRMLVAAGEVLADLPVTARLFAEGSLSWGQVRGIVGAVRRLGRAARAIVDGRLGATVAERGGVDAFDPDHLVEAVGAAVEELRDRRSQERSERRRAAASFLALQAGLDGGVRLYGELDPLLGAGVLNALDAAAGRPDGDARQGPHPPPGEPGGPDPGPAHTDATDDADADGHPGHTGAGGGEPEGDPAEATSRARQYAKALGRICADWLGGDTNRPARPLLNAHVQLADTTTRPSGTVELAVRGGLARISAATLEHLARDADLRAVLFDGARPLAVSGKVDAAAVPIATRRAVAARDLGCRFPGSRDPLAHTDVHHLTARACGGDHHPDGLACISRRFHTLTHRYDWTLTLDPATGEITARRGRRGWRSLPRAAGLSPVPASAEPDADDRAPPDGRDDHLPRDTPF